jgi:hypothetical protein
MTTILACGERERERRRKEEKRFQRRVNMT